MSANLTRSRSLYSRLTAALTIALVFWALGGLGAFQALDGLIYDWFLRTRARLCPEPDRVLLVEVAERFQLGSDERMLKLLQELRRLGARQVIFGILPPPSTRRFYEAALESGDLIFARTLAPDPADPEVLELVEEPVLAAHPRLLSGVAHAPPATSGTARGQHARFQVGGTSHPALEVKAASRAMESFAPPSSDHYLVKFRGPPGSLPRVAVDRLLAGELIPEVVAGKCVLVGLKPAPGEPGIHTPTTEGFQTMSLLEYQGHALNTLLSGSSIREPNQVVRLFLLVAVALAGVLAYQGLGVQAASWVTGGMLASYGAAAMLLFLYVETWIPMTEVFAAQATLFLVALRQRALRLTGTLQRLVSESASQLRDTYWPLYFYSSTPSWSLVANMITQTLDLNKLIFLEADRKTGKLREILAIHCSLGDIVEKRRDYNRPPYSDALNAKGPIKVTNFLKLTSNDEEQYLAPLVFSGELLGFWTIGIDSQKVTAIKQFEGLLSDYTRRISELLHHAGRANQRQDYGRTLRKRLMTESWEETYECLNSTLGLLHHRLTTLEMVINRASSGVIVYDIFGRVLQINEMMLGLLKNENLPPFEMTALDLILALSDHDVSKARRLLRQVIVENSPVSFGVTFRSRPGNSFFMHLRPLIEEPEKEAAASSKRIGARSILCELVDTSSTAYLYEMKSNLTSRLGLKLRNDLGAIDISASLLGGRGISESQRRRISEIIHTRIQKTVKTLSECQPYLALKPDGGELERFPLDPKPPLTAALGSIQGAASQRGVTVELVEPSFVGYVFSSAEKLEDLFRAILQLLMQDATDGGTVLVRVSETEDIVAFDFSDTGYGIPNELLQEYVFGEQPLASQGFQKVQEGAKWVKAWGGMLEASSSVGFGIYFTVHLVKSI